MRKLAICYLILGALLAGCAVVGFLLFVPLPARVYAPALLQPVDGATIYVTVPGRLEKATSAASRVKQGDELARLVNPELDYELSELRAHVALQRRQVELLERQQVHDTRAGIAGAIGQVPAARDALRDLEQAVSLRS